MSQSTAAAAPSKKRKRAHSESSGTDKDKISFALSNEPDTQLGPVVVSYPALQPGAKTPFTCYLRKPAEDGQAFVAQPTLVAGEGAAVEFVSSGEATAAASSSNCTYLVGVHNKRTRTTTLRPAPLHLLTTQVKALKGLAPAPVSAADRLKARHALGEAFGTKKAKSAIRAAERDVVDVGAMEGVAGHIQDSIDAGTGALPTQEEAKAHADAARLIPPYDPDAQAPADVYPLHNIIPEPEWKALNVNAIVSAKDATERARLLPHMRSAWVRGKVDAVCAAEKASRHALKIVYYVSALLAFRAAAHRLGDTSTGGMHERLKGVPAPVVDGLLARFTEATRGSTQRQTTPQTDTRLLTHMFALMLRADRYVTDAGVVASDLAMPATKINPLFKSLGCKITKPHVAELRLAGRQDGDRELKLAVLRTPVEFPKVRTKRGGRK